MYQKRGFLGSSPKNLQKKTLNPSKFIGDSSPVGSNEASTRIRALREGDKQRRGYERSALGEWEGADGSRRPQRGALPLSQPNEGSPFLRRAGQRASERHHFAPPGA